MGYEHALTKPEMVQLYTITRITSHGRHEMEDVLLREEIWTLYANENFVTQFNCLPSDLNQLAVGHLYCRHALRHKSQIDAIELDGERRRILVRLRDLPSSVSSTEVKTVFTVEEVHFLQKEFNERCHLFKETGAAHSCALANRSGVELYFEDVARHNSLDKVIGEMLLQDVESTEKALVFSGRLALDMIEKVVCCGVKVLIAPGAPSLAAVQLADKRRITLMGFVRADNINIYTHPERITQKLT